MRSRDFWWLIGYIQGDGFVDTVGREEIRLTSVDYDLINESKRLIYSLFGLEPKVHEERHNPPLKTQVRLAVYSKKLVSWLIQLGLKFGMRQWNVPKLPKDLFCPYLAGLFDGEGYIYSILNKVRQRKIRFVAICSTNKLSLERVLEKLAEFRVKSSMLERRRRTHYDYELRLTGLANLKWFIENVGVHSRLPRKRRLLREKNLPRRNAPKNGVRRKRTTNRLRWKRPPPL